MSKKLSLEETYDYLIKWRELNDQEAQTILVTSNFPLVKYFAKKYFNVGLNFDELQSAGIEGLIRAINKFDYFNNDIRQFSSYISMAIDNQIKMEIRKFKKHSHVLSFDEPIGHNKDGDEMTVEDIIGTDSEEIIESVISAMKIDIVRQSLKCLTSRERKIILLRFGLDELHRKTQSEVAEIFGCSRSLISKQEEHALMKMRHPRNTRKLKDFIDE
ncbi:MAG: sigma-70 family RNA polymerase sigma factor [Firmicutes bacterium]|nr:sigma-70 family RNA polymerase sigma factor [Bacillota bacterium]